MAFAIADRVQETTVTQGTGTVLLDGAVIGYQSFAVIGNLNTTYYTIADQAGANWEVGVGTYYLANSSLARTTILSSSNSNAAVSFGVGIKAVFVTYPAEQAILADPSNITTITNFVSSNVLITGGTITNVAIQGGTINGAALTNVTYSGLGTMSTQNANNVAITGGTINSVAQTGGSINNMTIGATTANTGAFTNVTASLFIGNGSPLSNLNASNITSGTLNVAYGGTGSANLTAGYVVLGNNTSQVVLVAPGTSGNVLTSNGTAWISNASSGGGGSTGIGNSSILALNVNITANATINAGVNGFSVGPVNTANGVVVTITSGSRWVII
jgi:hypothetical protein